MCVQFVEIQYVVGLFGSSSDLYTEGPGTRVLTEANELVGEALEWYDTRPEYAMPLSSHVCSSRDPFAGGSIHSVHPGDVEPEESGHNKQIIITDFICETVPGSLVPKPTLFTALLHASMCYYQHKPERNIITVL